GRGKMPRGPGIADIARADFRHTLQGPFSNLTVVVLQVEITGPPRPAQAPARAWIVDADGTLFCHAVHCRSRDRTIVVAQDNVGLTIAIDVEDLRHMPTRVATQIGYADLGRAIHEPSCDLAVVVLQNDVGMTVAIQISRSGHMPGE